MAGFTHKLYKLLGIKLAMSTAYHPQTDGQTERINQELEGYLRMFTSQRQDDWDDLLPLGEFSHNNNVHSSTQQTPFMLDTGRHPRMGFEAKSAIAKAKDEYTMYYNRRREPTLVFKPGDKVWLDGSNITTNRPSSKLSHQRLGPFVIKACVGRGTYRLALPPHFCRLHPVFPMVKLSIAHPDPILGRHPAPPPPTTLIDGEDEYEVEAILDSRMRYNHLEYLVKWKGYDESNNQWEEHMQLHTKSKIAQFYRKHPSAACHINAALFNSISFTRADLATSWRSLRVVTPHF
jgi:hypothetical protein